jgi:hypothetical protein
MPAATTETTIRRCAECSGYIGHRPRNARYCTRCAPAFAADTLAGELRRQQRQAWLDLFDRSFERLRWHLRRERAERAA